ncbi:MAG TPA: response regulator [Roseiflexaceae bacterium]|nr:response regulator [Roseiflexaceae bacterium]
MGDTDDNQARFTHTFSSPLTAMRGAIDLLRNPRRTADDPVSRELIETLERSCARLRRNIDTLLAFSRIHGDMVEIVVPLDTLLGAGDSPATPPDRHLPPAPAPGVPWTEAASAPDRSAGRGSVLIIADHMPEQGAIGAALRASGYQLMVVESGPEGIDVARARHPDLVVLDLDLAQPGAQQVAQVLSEDPETKTIPMIYAVGHAPPPDQLPPNVELLHRGAPPETLPALADQIIAAARARAEQIPTLLIVDDDADIQRILTLRLEQDGYRVVPATTGAEALIAAQKQPFDLIILDLLLPDIDGLSVLGALRARTASAMTPILLLSARDSPQQKVLGLQLGADDYVTKPFSPAELQARIRATLRRHERAAGANPSTRLPGNIAIERTLRHRIQQHADFAVCYADIDNFKAYNDTYSFLKGDAVIQQTAHVLLQAIELHGNHDDFVGHIGGDDFVVITTPDRAERISSHAIASFDLLAPLFYDAATRERGYIDAHDRQGRPALFPFVSLSIGIVSTALHPIAHVAEVAQRSVEPKKRAKELPGSAYVFED